MSSRDDINGTDPQQTPDPRHEPAEGDAHPGWLYSLNSFLEGAFLKADVDTGC